MRLIFLVVSRAMSALGLSRREAWWKDAEILMLRHQLAVALRERPRAHSRLTSPDRAWLAPRHRPPPVGTVVPPVTFRPATSAPHCAVGGARAGAGDRVMGVPAHPR
jgi:hypothetical protein